MDKNIALIGAGYWGKNHLRALYNLGVLQTVVDNNEETLNKMRKKFPCTRYVNDGDITPPCKSLFNFWFSSNWV